MVLTMIAALFLGELVAAEDALRAHVQCAEHGDLCHVDPAVAATTALGTGRLHARIDAGPVGERTGDDHDHCGVDHSAAPRLEHPPHIAALLGALEPNEPPTPGRPSVRVTAALFRLAPKLSPPRG